MDIALQGAVGSIELFGIETVAQRQAEQREVILREVDQTLKLSPQPH
jgi:hypothetical protein